MTDRCTVQDKAMPFGIVEILGILVCMQNGIIVKDLPIRAGEPRNAWRKFDPSLGES